MEQILKHKALERYFQKFDVKDVKTIVGQAELRAFVAGVRSYY